MALKMECDSCGALISGPHEMTQMKFPDEDKMVGAAVDLCLVCAEKIVNDPKALKARKTRDDREGRTEERLRRAERMKTDATGAPVS